MVSQIERWGDKIINLANLTDAMLDGDDVLVWSAGNYQVRLIGAASRWVAHFTSPVTFQNSTTLLWIGSRLVNITNWFAADLAENLLYSQEPGFIALTNGKLAAAQAMLAALPDQMAV